MPGFNTLPAVGGGGGQANMTYVASVHMETYNRSWAQGGTAGYYALYSTNQENGYAYFVGTGTTTGVALNRLANISHSFTRIDIIAPQNDMVSLYKAKVKSTTAFNNPFSAFSSFPSVIRSSGNFVLPNNALPLVNVLVSGAGGHGGHGTHNGAGGGGGGGGVVKLTAFQAVGTTAVTISSCNSGNNGGTSGTTYFGNVYALGGGAGGHRGGHNGGSGANGGGGSNHNSSGGSGITQTTSTGLGTSGTPIYYGGHSGGHGSGSNNHHGTSGAGGGALAAGTSGSGNHGQTNGGIGHVSDIEGSNHMYGAGGAGGEYNGRGTAGWSGHSARGHGGQSGNENDNNPSGDQGTVILRYYIP
jgi:hypothetical protein